MFKRIVRIFFVFILILLLGGSLDSCKTTRLENKAIKEMEHRQTKINANLVKEYDKKYKRQTKIQSDQQRKMIEQSRKKPKNMRTTKRFFLFRWLGI